MKTNNDPVKPKKGKIQTTKSVTVSNKPKKKGSSALDQFKQGFKDSFKPIIDGMKTAIPSKRTKEDFVKGFKSIVPKRKNIRQAIESSPENKAANVVKKAVGYKTGGMVNSNTSVVASKVAKGKVGGKSQAPKTAVPKAKYGMSMRRK
jgi:hypothetical protein